MYKMYYSSKVFALLNGHPSYWKQSDQVPSCLAFQLYLYNIALISQTIQFLCQ